MRMKEFNRRKRLIVSLTIVPLVVFLLDVPLFATPAVQEKPEVQNVRLEIKEEVATITYDLVGQPDQTYEIVATLVKEGDLSFRIPVKSATGDIGKGIYSGLSRQIQWDWKKDLPKDFTGGAGYSVEITVIPVSSGGGSWLYYVLGGALIAGGVVALTGGKKSEGGGTQTTVPLGLPSPPGRPF